MAGIVNDVLYALNSDFTGGNSLLASESNGLVTNGKMWIGSTAVNSGGTHINVGSITSPSGTVTIGYSSPNITLDVSGAAVTETLTGNSGGALSPTAGNFNILGTGSTTVAGSGSTLTAQLTGLTNHALLVGAGTATITKLGLGSAGQVLQSGGAAADPVYSTATYPSATVGTGKILYDNGTNYVTSVPTFPTSASATSRKMTVSDGTNWVASTETWAVPGTSGNVLTSDGTNWTAVPGVQMATVTLTSAQIKALHGTPIQIVAAPGAGKVICVLAAIYCNFIYGGTNVFVAGASQDIALWYGTTTKVSTTGLVFNATLTGTTSLISTGNISSNASITLASFENLAINAYNSVVTEISGNAANNNTVTMTFAYYIATL
jgi:hypothetical protein